MPEAGTVQHKRQDKTAPVFVVATANDVAALPPEMLRKGRFDELFFSDLPTLSERAEILRIHIKGRKRDPDKYGVEEIAQEAANFSGAELAQVVVDSLYMAFQEGREPTTMDMIRAIGKTTPLFNTMQEKITRLREWAKTRAVAANEAHVDPSGLERVRRPIVSN